MDQASSLIFSYLLLTVYFTALSVPQCRRTDMGQIGNDMEGSCRSVIEEKCRRLVDDTKEVQGRSLRNQDTKREQPEFKLEILLLDPTCSVSLFGVGGGNNDDEVNSSVSCRRYHSSYTVMSLFLNTCHFHFRLLYRKVTTILIYACRLVSANISYFKIYHETWMHVIPKL
jgi:hypothetical protein